MTEKTHRETVRRAIAENRKARKALASKTRVTVRNGVPVLPHRPGASPEPTLALVNRLRDES